MNAKAVQMIAVPTHEHLDDPVQVRDRPAVLKLDPAPNRGMNIPQQELQLQQQSQTLSDHHPDDSSRHPVLPPFCDGLPTLQQPDRGHRRRHPSHVAVEADGPTRLNSFSRAGLALNVMAMAGQDHV